MTTPLSAYQALLKDGTLSPDPAQLAAVTALDLIAGPLSCYQPGKKRSWFGTKAPAAPRGLYLWGGVGVGKSLLMDLFIENTNIAKKRRVHFHAFMQETHDFIADWRSMDDQGRRKHKAYLRNADINNPIPHAANAVFQSAHLLCFDEFHVTDITDAMLLARLFDTLYNLGVVVIATSNRHPNDLYKDGINRGLFTPFIQRTLTELDIIELVGAKDYRLDRLENEPLYFTPLGEDANTQMDSAWHALTAAAVPEVGHINVHGRDILIPHYARGTARGSFDHWCRSMFGPRDYLLLAASFPIFFIDNIPQLSSEERNPAKRFVTLIDALYEARCTLVCSAAAVPDILYTQGDGAFEFSRTASRLYEMQSKDYLQLSHTAEMDPAAEVD